MGQGQSQPAEHAQNGEIDGGENTQDALSHSSSPATSTKSKSKSHEAAPKRKRKSSQRTGRTSSITVASSEQSPKAKRNKIVDNLATNDGSTSEQHPKPAKRQKIVDNLATNDASAPGRKTKTKTSSSQSTPLNQPQINALRNDYKMSPSPALSTGSFQAKGRLNRANGTTNAKGATGAFKPAEVEALENFKIEFCNSNGCSAATFDLMVQHGFEGTFPDVNGIKKQQFWQKAREILPERDRRSVNRFMKRHFQASGQKPHEWTPEQDDELVALYKQHGPKWTQIGEDLGRSADDVVQRWKNRLEHRATMNIGAWSEGELGIMKKALRDAWSKLKAEGYDVGENIYQMDESLISWGQVSKNMGHCRSRQQCADKWRGVKASLAASGSQVNSRANSQSMSRSATPASSLKQAKSHRSATYVNSEDDESDVPDHGENERKSRPTPQRSTGQKSTGPTKDEPSAPGEHREAESSQDESEDGSSSGSENSGSSSDSESEPEPNDEKLAASPTIKMEPGTGDASQTTAQKRSSTSSSDSDSDESGSGSEESDSDSSEDTGAQITTQDKKAVEGMQPVKQESNDDESSGSSSSNEESDSDSEDESINQYFSSKGKQKGASTIKANTEEDKGVIIKREPTSEDDSDESDDESTSTSEQQAKSAPRNGSSESETDAEDSSNDRKPNIAQLRGRSPSGSSTSSGSARQAQATRKMRTMRKQ
ncbi:MYB DNA-binding domain protein [Aspergillus undulatus]|uniref:MYB DNA-binding domain protein n=1 Tax=Aspergillus undulatus TaxID=1810928 RepID=UPI003CCD07FC